MANSSVGTYCYDIALSKVQFSSNTSFFSPNNVRRIFISGDGVMVQLFVNTGTGKIKQGRFNPIKAFDCFCDKNYKPVVQCLVDLVCSNLEEIVFCTSTKSGIKLNQSELNLTALLKGYSGSLSPDLAQSLLGRFPRLREIVMFSGTLQDVIDLSGSEVFRDYSKLFTDCYEDKKLFYIQSLNNKDWFKQYRLRPQHYVLDMKGGKLSVYFDTVRSKLETKDKEDKIKEMNTQRFGKKQEVIDKRNLVATNMLISLKKYSNCSKKTYIDTAWLLKGISAPQDLTKYNLSKEVVDAFSRGSVNNNVKEESEKYDLVSASLSKLSENCYTMILESFFSAVFEYSERKVTLSVKLRDFDASKVVVPNGISASSVEELLGVKFSSEGSIVNSLAILLAYLCKLNVASSQIKDKQMYTVSYWSGLLHRKER